MAATPEGRVKQQVKKLLDKHEIWYFMPGNNGYGKSGIPDIVAIVDGQFWGIEVKSEVGSLTSLQKKRGGEIEDAGGLFLVIQGVAGVRTLEGALIARKARSKMMIPDGGDASR